MVTQFLTDDNLTVPAITTEQMREIDRLAMESAGLTLLQMMENAGRNLAELALHMMGPRALKTKIVVLAGTGNNGGGGICAARHLLNRGIPVRVWISGPPKSEATKTQLQIFQNSGGTVFTTDDLRHARANLIIDAMVGYGLHGAPGEAFIPAIEWARNSKGFKLALDVPTGVDATTGETPGTYLRADATLTLALPKTGLLPEHCGNVYLGDIGIPASVFQAAGIPYHSPFAGRFVIPLLPFPHN